MLHTQKFETAAGPPQDVALLRSLSLARSALHRALVTQDAFLPVLERMARAALQDEGDAAFVTWCDLGVEGGARARFQDATDSLGHWVAMEPAGALIDDAQITLETLAYRNEFLRYTAEFLAEDPECRDAAKAVLAILADAETLIGALARLWSAQLGGLVSGGASAVMAAELERALAPGLRAAACVPEVIRPVLEVLLVDWLADAPASVRLSFADILLRNLSAALRVGAIHPDLMPPEFGAESGAELVAEFGVGDDGAAAWISPGQGEGRETAIHPDLICFRSDPAPLLDAPKEPAPADPLADWLPDLRPFPEPQDPLLQDDGTEVPDVGPADPVAAAPADPPDEAAFWHFETTGHHEIWEPSFDPVDFNFEELTPAEDDQDETPARWRLDHVAASLVLRLDRYRIADMDRLQRRFLAILDEFPFGASCSALAWQIDAGTTLEELEEAARLKILWRDSPWLWKRRSFNRMVGGWEITSDPRQRHALSWRAAVSLIRNHGLVDTEHGITDIWYPDWVDMVPGNAGQNGRYDPGFGSYAAFVAAYTAAAIATDHEGWHYDEAADRRGRAPLHLRSATGKLIWAFAPTDLRGQSEPTSGLSLAERKAAAGQKEGQQ